EEGSASERQGHAALRQSLHGQRKQPDDRAPHRSDQKEHAPTRGHGHASVNRESFRDPRHTSQRENQSMQESAGKRDPAPRAQNTGQQKRQAYPRIQTRIAAAIGQRQDGAAENRQNQPHGGGSFRRAVRPQVGMPSLGRHQRFT